METFGLHELILSVSEDYFSVLICVDNVGIETFDLLGLTLMLHFYTEPIIAQLHMMILHESTYT